MGKPHLALIEAVRSGLRAHADPAKAPGMQAYMKSAMPYLGAQSPTLRRVCRAAFAEHPLPTEELWRTAVLALWREARFREERYAAIELTGHRAYQVFQTPAVLPIYEEMIVSGAWWDHVDAVAIHRLGPILRSHPGPVKAVMLEWSRDGNLWKRRSSIICQVLFKGDIDLDLLHACIEPNLRDRDFFIRKAIGWALRSHAWIDPEEIVRYVDAKGSALSALSRREALKNVGPMVRASPPATPPPR